MTKSDWLWIAIRVLGLFFLAKALLVLPAIPPSILVFKAVGESFEVTGKDKMTTIMKQMHDHAGSVMVKSISECVLFGMTGLYLTKRGRWIHRIIMPPEN